MEKIWKGALLYWTKLQAWRIARKVRALRAITPVVFRHVDLDTGCIVVYIHKDIASVEYKPYRPIEATMGH